MALDEIFGEKRRKEEDYEAEESTSSKLIKYGAPIAGLLVWGSTIGYSVDPDEQAVVKQFGKYVGTTGPGFHGKLPWPIQTADVIQSTSVQRVEVGFRTIRGGWGEEDKITYEDHPEETTMMTADENLVDGELVVQYIRKDPAKMLFKIGKENEEKLVRFETEAAFRAVTSKKKIDAALTTEKAIVQLETHERLQTILDKLDSGLYVTSVQLQDIDPPIGKPDKGLDVRGAFNDVQGAKENKEQFINEGLKYKNSKMPDAEAKAFQILQQAEAYNQTRILEAQGAAARWEKLSEAHKKAPDEVKTKLYYEAMSAMLPGKKIIIADGPLIITDTGSKVIPLTEKTDNSTR